METTMAAQRHITTLRPALVLLAGVILVLSGCVTTPENECRVQEANAKTLDLNTHYHPAPRMLAFGPLPRGMLAEATLYRVNINETRVRPCQTITIRKELYLRRHRHADLIFKETREFYAEDGTLIASHTEDLTNQLRASGSYTALTLLPIPRTAPTGNYLIVSKLAFQRRGDRRSFLLGRAEVTFHILPGRMPASGPAQTHKP